MTHTNGVVDLEQITSIRFKDGNVYERYVAGESPEGKVLLIAIPLKAQTETYKGKSFNFWAKIGNFNKGIKIAEDMNLLVRANPPQVAYNSIENSDFSL